MSMSPLSTAHIHMHVHIHILMNVHTHVCIYIVHIHAEVHVQCSSGRVSDKWIYYASKFHYTNDNDHIQDDIMCIQKMYATISKWNINLYKGGLYVHVHVHAAECIYIHVYTYPAVTCFIHTLAHRWTGS